MRITANPRRLAGALLALMLGVLPARAGYSRIISPGCFSAGLNGTEIQGNYGVRLKSPKSAATGAILQCKHLAPLPQEKWVDRRNSGILPGNAVLRAAPARVR